MTNSQKKLAVIVLGKKNAGKSNTWYKFFNSRVKTKKKLIELAFNSNEFTEVFLLNGSMEERKRNIEDELLECDILLCSVQYTEKGKQTIEYLHHQGYELLVYWLNPGCDDKKVYLDKLEIIKMIKNYPNSIVKTCKAIKDDNDTEIRSKNIMIYIYQWAKKENLVKAN